MVTKQVKLQDILSELLPRPNSYQPDSDYVIIKQTTEQLLYYKTYYETFEKDGGTFFKIVSKIAPGVVAKSVFDYMRKVRTAQR